MRLKVFKSKATPREFRALGRIVEPIQDSPESPKANQSRYFEYEKKKGRKMSDKSDKNDKAWIVEKLLDAHGALYNPLEVIALILSHDLVHDVLNDRAQEMLHDAYDLMDESISLVHYAIEEIGGS